MPSNKDRLYLGLYARASSAKMPGKEDTYVITYTMIDIPADRFAQLPLSPVKRPKKENENPHLEEGTKFHAKEFPKSAAPGFEFAYEGRPVLTMPVDMMLVRVMLAKAEDKNRLAMLLRQVPIGQREQGGWNFVAWVREALLRIERSEGVVGTSVLGWEAVREAALSYCRLKRNQRRFDGSGEYDATQVPTFDMILTKETAT